MLIETTSYVGIPVALSVPLPIHAYPYTCKAYLRKQAKLQLSFQEKLEELQACFCSNMTEI
jgi:hypothetical protein